MEFDAKDIEEGKSLAWMAYLGILFLVPLLSQRQNPFSMFHVKQGIVLLGVWFVGFVLSILQMVLHLVLAVADVPSATCCFDSFFLILQLGVYILAIVLAIMGIVKALSGEAWEMPVLGKIAQRINL